MEGTTGEVRDTASPRRIAWAVGRDVNRTLGGSASMELLRRSLVARGWMNDRDHALLVAVSRFTPGTNILAYCVALGWQLAQWRGAAAALAAASVPASVLVALLSATLASLHELPLVRAIVAIALIAAAVLVLATAWNLLRPYLRGANAARTAVLAAVAVALTMMGATPIRILLVAAVLGVVMASPAAPTVPDVERRGLID